MFHVCSRQNPVHKKKSSLANLRKSRTTHILNYEFFHISSPPTPILGGATVTGASGQERKLLLMEINPF